MDPIVNPPSNELRRKFPRGPRKLLIKSSLSFVSCATSSSQSPHRAACSPSPSCSPRLVTLTSAHYFLSLWTGDYYSRPSVAVLALNLPVPGQRIGNQLPNGFAFAVGGCCAPGSFWPFPLGPTTTFELLVVAPKTRCWSCFPNLISYRRLFTTLIIWNRAITAAKLYQRNTGG